jgi:HAE1 family hydrophobic/amphiphilic exporter-1
MLIIALVVVGAASYFRLGVDRFPAVDVPTVTVRASLRGALPSEMEAEVSDKIERAVNTVEGIQELRSVSFSGSGFVAANFSLDRDIDVAAQDVRDRVATVVRELPEDVDPPIVSKYDSESQPVMTVALYGNRTVRELSELADKVVRTQLERSAGVGQVQLRGELVRSVNIWVDAEKLIAYQIPITAVRDALQRQNSDVPGGNVTGAQREQTLRTVGKLETPEAFNDLIVTTINGAPIRIRDIGRAEDGHKEQRSISRLNGTPTVLLEVQRQSKANTVEVIESAKANLLRIQEQLPPDVKLEVIRDQTRYIYNALHEINLHLVLGSILASLVVLAFMRSWRSTIIAAVAIPASVVATFGMMWALDFTLNSVTMLALVLMVGVVIDDAIVVLENIFRWVEEKKMSPFDAAREATREIGLAVLATTLSLVVIFVPVSFMSSISGRFLYQFGITAAVSVMVSLLVSFTLTPMMSARMLRAEDAAKGHGGHGEAGSRRGFYHWIDAGYTWLLHQSMRFRALIAIVAVAVVITSVPLYRMVKQEYVPSDVDEGEFEVRVTANEGTNLPAINDAMLQIERDLREMPQIETILASSGGGFSGGVNRGEVYVRLRPHEDRVFTFTRLWNGLAKLDFKAAFRGNYTQRDVMQQVRGKLRKYPNVRISVRGFQTLNTGFSPADIEFVFLGPDLDKLLEYAERLRDMTRDGTVPGVVDADTTLKLDKPELRVEIDRARAADLGVDASDIGTALRLMVGGDDEASRFRDPQANEDYDVELRLTEKDRNDPAIIEKLYVARRGGGLVQLANLATVKTDTSASRIDRLDRQRMVALRAGVAPGYALADRLQALRDAADTMDIPAGYTVRVSGRGRELEQTFNEFVWAFILSVIFMYIILAMNYESLIHPLTILLSLPLTVPFALLSLYLTGGTLNLYSALGILVLFGVVKKNSILQIDHMNQLRSKGYERYDAIIQGNRDRLRPILMTTLALVAGMLPLAIGSGPGAEERRAVAIVVIGGQSLALLLTLLVTPVAYSYFDDIGGLFRRRVAAQRSIPAERSPLAPLAPEPVAIGRTQGMAPEAGS